MELHTSHDGSSGSLRATVVGFVNSEVCGLGGSFDFFVVYNWTDELHTLVLHRCYGSFNRFRDLKSDGDRTLSSGRRFFGSWMQTYGHPIIGLEARPLITEPIFHSHPKNFGIEPDGPIHIRDKYSDNGHGSSLRG